tara:strand:- start:1443 stop:2312 length:870 start_codon:yes stop_codon:yes gene_type:complete
MNFVLSVNDNSTYFTFLEKATALYKKLGHKVYIAYVTKKADHEWQHLNADAVVIYPELDGYESGIQAKLARSFLASQLDTEEALTLLDVDQFVINFKWLEKNIKENSLEEYDLLGFGANGYKTHGGYNPNIDGKFAMYFTTAKPSGFRKLYGIEKGATFSDLMAKFALIENARDGYESTKNNFNHFSDESLFAWMIREHDVRVKHIDIPDFYYLKNQRRIDRTIEIMLAFNTPNFDRGFWHQKSLTDEQKKMIQTDYFTDVFPARPYEAHADIIDDIIDAIAEKELASL